MYTCDLLFTKQGGEKNKENRKGNFKANFFTCSVPTKRPQGQSQAQEGNDLGWFAL